MIFIQKNVLPKIKDGANVTNLDEFKSIATHWIALYVNNGTNKATYLNSFGVENIPKKKFKHYRKQKYHDKCLQNTSIRFDNMWILLYWVYWFYAKR